MNLWIQYKFRFDHPPEWWIDIYLIDTAFRKIIEKYNIQLYRFHRRDADDGIGHQLSLFCYVTEIVLEKIKKDLFNDVSIKLLDENSMHKSKSIEIFNNDLNSTSDKNWSIELQYSWVYFINGVSKMLLDLISNIKNHKIPDNLKDLKKSYNKINNELSLLYSVRGSHAFIHHISALFGYAPTILKI